MQRTDTMHPNYHYIHSKSYASHTEIKLLYNGRRSQPSAEKIPVRGAGRKRWRLEIQNTYTAVRDTRVSGTTYEYVGIFYRSFF